MAVRIDVSDRLVVRLTGWDRVWAVSAGVDVPLSAVRAVRPMPRREAEDLTRGLRLPGSYLPGVVHAGSYWSRSGGWSFWCAYRAETVLVIDLEGERYGHLVLQVEDPLAASREIAVHVFR